MPFEAIKYNNLETVLKKILEIPEIPHLNLLPYESSQNKSYQTFIEENIEKLSDYNRYKNATREHYQIQIINTECLVNLLLLNFIEEKIRCCIRKQEKFQLLVIGVIETKCFKFYNNHFHDILHLTKLHLKNLVFLQLNAEPKWKIRTCHFTRYLNAQNNLRILILNNRTTNCLKVSNQIKHDKPTFKFTSNQIEYLFLENYPLSIIGCFPKLKFLQIIIQPYTTTTYKIKLFKYFHPNFNMLERLVLVNAKIENNEAIYPSQKYHNVSTILSLTNIKVQKYISNKKHHIMIYGNRNSSYQPPNDTAYQFLYNNNDRTLHLSNEFTKILTRNNIYNTYNINISIKGEISPNTLMEHNKTGNIALSPDKSLIQYINYIYDPSTKNLSNVTNIIDTPYIITGHNINQTEFVDSSSINFTPELIKHTVDCRYNQHSTQILDNGNSTRTDDDLFTQIIDDTYNQNSIESSNNESTISIDSPIQVINDIYDFKIDDVLLTQIIDDIYDQNSLHNLDTKDNTKTDDDLSMQVTDDIHDFKTDDNLLIQIINDIYNQHSTQNSIHNISTDDDLLMQLIDDTHAQNSIEIPNNESTTKTNSLIEIIDSIYNQHSTSNADNNNDITDGNDSLTQITDDIYDQNSLHNLDSKNNTKTDDDLSMQVTDDIHDFKTDDNLLIQIINDIYNQHSTQNSIHNISTDDDLLMQLIDDTHAQNSIEIPNNESTTKTNSLIEIIDSIYNQHSTPNADNNNDITDGNDSLTQITDDIYDFGTDDDLLMQVTDDIHDLHTTQTLGNDKKIKTNSDLFVTNIQSYRPAKSLNIQNI
ncbi:hypothetical protein [Ehrlichia chaffeensis]|uniref:hypothetical protein n=1 Tax=Ehrlichia chaffeensis TaxID=945 RepID=UPI000444D551|nr:hypothetical protein [Ehrlichia chaffeensis]AHX08605.1 hypothetical protein ECHSTV_0264 [Ehrlichia chaffeensis str. Saint Vincent]